MKVLTLFCLIYVFAVTFTNAQENYDNPISLTIETNNKYFCFGQSAHIKARIVNIGNTPLVIDTNQIGYRSNFSWFSSNSKVNTGGALIITRHGDKEYLPNFIILQPNESYVENYSFLLEDKILSSKRKYLMKIAYGQSANTKYENTDVWRGVVESNEIEILIKKCGAN